MRLERFNSPGSFPDAIFSEKRGRWVQRRVEFELRSSDFKGHNIDECDLIVCWHHDWEDCPIRVYELKSLIKHPKIRAGRQLNPQDKAILTMKTQAAWGKR